MRFIVTGAAGFVGSVMAEYLVDHGHEVLSIDWLPYENPKYKNVQVDIRNVPALTEAIRNFGHVDAIFHLAVILEHDREHAGDLDSVNVGGTRSVLEAARALKIPKVIFLSTSCLFSMSYDRPVNESEPLAPADRYGRSKLEAEKVIAEYKDVSTFVVRCPNIMAAGRLGLLTILFDFVREGRRLYVIGKGSNRHSFIGAEDLARACLLACEKNAEGIYHIGSDNVPTMFELYRDVQIFAGQKPNIVFVPAGPSTAALRLVNALGVSPLGPYHCRILTANFIFDNSKIKRDLGWSPTRTNTEILCEAYKYYVDNYEEITKRSGVSVHKSKAHAGILNLLRLVS
jgi:nucleoside-diphosphate-sugar epimerase